MSSKEEPYSEAKQKSAGSCALRRHEHAAQVFADDGLPDAHAIVKSMARNELWDRNQIAQGGKMALFLELTGVDDVKQFVNVEQITHLASYSEGGGAFTRIDFDHHHVVEVKETPARHPCQSKAGWRTMSFISPSPSARASPLGGAAALSLVLDRADDRGEDQAARATRNCRRDYAVDTEVAGLCRRNKRWQNQRHDLTEHAAADDA